MSKVTKVRETLHGHHLVELSNDHQFPVHRGAVLPEIGDEYTDTYPPKRVKANVAVESVQHPTQVIVPDGDAS